ncbi:hypothetical protein [Aneurinibacillus danicus]|nr:hypothetical protein [Aneurinibacillus danicus]
MWKKANVSFFSPFRKEGRLSDIEREKPVVIRPVFTFLSTLFRSPKSSL